MKHIEKVYLHLTDKPDRFVQQGSYTEGNEVYVVIMCELIVVYCRYILHDA